MAPTPESAWSEPPLNSPEPWLEHQFDRWCRVVRLSHRVRVEHFTQIDPISVEIST